MLTTKRLTLRVARQDDLNDLFAIYSDPRAMQYWSTPPHDTPARTQENLDRMIDVPDPVVYFVMEMTGQVIGTIGVHNTNEFGFLLHPDHWRQGIISEATSAILPYLWRTMTVDELIADVDPNNAASIAALRKFGFVETHTAEKTFCLNGVWSDSVYFALKRRYNWNRNKLFPP